MVISVLSAIYSGNKEEKKKMVLSLKKKEKRQKSNKRWKQGQLKWLVKFCVRGTCVGKVQENLQSKYIWT